MREITKNIPRFLKKFWEPAQVILATIGATTAFAAAINVSVIGGTLFKLLTTLIGTFVGGFLAFSLNRSLQREKKSQEDRAALALAANVIAGQVTDFLVYKLSLYQCINYVAEAFQAQGIPLPAIGIWSYVRPIPYAFNTANTIELKSLSFLVSDPKQRSLTLTFSRLQQLERSHLNFIHQAKLLQEAAVDIQKGLDARTKTVKKEMQAATVKEFEEYLGPELINRMIDCTVHLLVHAEENADIYIQAIKQLKASAEIIWGEQLADSWNIEAVMKAYTLPELPTPLRQEVDNLRAQVYPLASVNWRGDSTSDLRPERTSLRC